MKVIITNTFKYYLEKYRIDKNILIKEFIKYRNTNNCLKIGEIGSFIICKGYLLGKEKRILTIIENNNFVVPIIIIKKESKKGWNINKDNVKKDFSSNFDKVFFDLENGLVEEVINYRFNKNFRNIIW